MPVTETYIAHTREEWRQWLSLNRDKKTEIWLVYFKKGTSVQGVSYEESVEEAICYGWIDSLIHRIDGEKYARKFTPRKKNSRWSLSNWKRVQKLKKEGRLHPSGLKVIPTEVLEGKQPIAENPSIESVPEEFAKLLHQNKQTDEIFNNLSPSVQRQFINWIGTAKKSATRYKRAKEAIELINKGLKLGMK